MERSANNNTREICLVSGVENLGKGSLKIEICEGSAWVTCDNDDMILDVGEIVAFDSNRYPIVISPAYADKPVTFKVIDGNAETSQPVVRSTSLLRAMMSAVVK